MRGREYALLRERRIVIDDRSTNGRPETDRVHLGKLGDFIEKRERFRDHAERAVANGIGDFFAGLITFDPSEDDFTKLGPDKIDDKYDTIQGATPMHRLGRGFSNLLFGIWELPQNWMDVTADQGPVAGSTYGTVRGLGRFIVREVTGIWEIILYVDEVGIE